MSATASKSITTADIVMRRPSTLELVCADRHIGRVCCLDNLVGP